MGVYFYFNRQDNVWRIPMNADNVLNAKQKLNIALNIPVNSLFFFDAVPLLGSNPVSNKIRKTTSSIFLKLW